MFLKDPDAVLDYRIDWRDGLAPGLAIETSAWDVRPGEEGGLIVTGSAIDAEITTVRLAGGVAGHVYEVSNRIAISDGSVDDRSVVLRVEER